MLKTALAHTFPSAMEMLRDVRRWVRRRRVGAGDVGVFNSIATAWGGQSLSGTGSDLQQTAAVRRELPRLLAQLEASSMLDIPCGDWFWMKDVDLGSIDYTGADIVEAVVASCRERFPSRKFEVLNLVTDALPPADVVFCRDCFVHLPIEMIRAAIENIRPAAKYLITTTFPNHSRNVDITTGDWRPINLQAAPFFFPEPIALINEACTEAPGFEDKSLGVWRTDRLP